MAIGYEKEMERLGGYNPDMSKEMKASGQMEEMEMTISDDDAMEMEEEDVFAQLAPQGPFSAKAMNQLVKATNALLPAFEQEGDYPTFDADVDVMPTDFVRVIAMFQGAVNAAVDADMIDPEMDFELEQLTDDRSLTLLAGKLSALARSRDFKQFLKEPPMEMEMEVAEEEGGEPEMADGDINALFAMRV